jgi:Tol biopolymer transport system component
VRRLVSVAVLVAGAALVPGGAATGSSPVPLLTYTLAPVRVGGADLSLGICATDLDGHTFRISQPTWDASPRWSSDGRSLAFTGPAAPVGQDHFVDLFVRDGDGSTHDLTSGGGRGTPSVFGWSPDGTEVGGNWSGFGSSVFIAKADGTGSRLLVPFVYGTYVWGESWSPDGRRILISRSNSNPLLTSISGINADGTNERKLVGGAERARWSPDGQRIAYVSYGDPRGLGVAQADGGEPRILARSPIFVGAPAWSPDGSLIAYVTSAGGSQTSLDVAQADGSGTRTLANGVLDTPQWSPDGRLIAFTRGSADAPRVAVIKPDGSGEQDVPTGGLAASEPTWRPAAPMPSGRRPCVVRGTSRADVIHGTGRGDVIFAGTGADRVFGGGGNDVLVGGLGPDRLDGGAGADLFGARDRTRDYLTGGPGSDTAYVDRVDLRSSIEKVH